MDKYCYEIRLHAGYKEESNGLLSLTEDTFYRTNWTCAVTIEVPPDRKIALMFLDMDISGNQLGNAETYYTLN